MIDVSLRQKLIHNYISHLKTGEGDRISFGDDNLIDTMIALDNNGVNYNNIIKMGACKTINRNLKLNDIKHNFSLVLEQLVVLANGERESLLRDYKTAVDILEYIINENELCQKYEVALMQQFKDFIDQLDETKIGEICKKYGVMQDANFNKEIFLSNITKAFVELNNKRASKYDGAFRVNNSSPQITINGELDIDKIRKQFVKYLQTHKLKSTVTNSTLASYLQSATDEQVKEFYIAIAYKQQIDKQRLQELIKKYTRNIKDPTLPSIIIETHTQEKLEAEEELKKISVPLIQNLWLLSRYIDDNLANTINIGSALGRRYNEPEYINPKRPENRHSLIVDLINRKKFESYSTIDHPELRDNLNDDKKRLAFYKNLGMFLKFGVLCRYSADGTFIEEYKYRLEEYDNDCMDKYYEKCSYMNRIGEDENPDDEKRVFVNIPNLESEEDVDAQIVKVEKELKHTTKQLRDLQKEFAIHESDLGVFSGEPKVVVKELTTPNGKYQILKGRMLNYEDDGYIYHIYVKEIVQLYDEFSEVLYLLPDGTLNCPQQILRIDSLDKTALDIAGKHRDNMSHRPVGIGKKEKDKWINSKNHSHIYTPIETLVSQLTDEGLINQQDVGHFGIDVDAGDLLSPADIEEYFNKKYSIVDEFEDELNFDE